MQAADSAYDVALSFAGEDRAHALALATRLHAAGYAVFFDRFEELWGQDLTLKLHAVYAERSRYCVVFVSEHYLRKPWTNLERQILVGRAMQQQTLCLLPIRVDGSDLPGLPGVVAYKDLREESIDGIFASLCRLLGAPAPAPATPAAAPGPLRLYPSDFLYVVAQQDSLDTARFNLGCHLVNQGGAACRLQRLEAAFTPEGQCSLQFMAAERLYEISSGGRAMQRSEHALPLAFGAGASRLHGVQFVGPRLDPALVWRAGTHTLDLFGWVDTAARRLEADLHSRFAVQIGNDDLRRLVPWFAATSAANEVLLPAVALPVTITSPSAPVAR